MTTDVPRVATDVAFRYGPQPGYRHLFSELYEHVRSGAWAAGSQIPSERELCDRYGVSRTMVRRALLEAERHGLIVRVPGRGTFVARPRVVQDLARMSSFAATLGNHTLTPTRRVVQLDWEPASADVAGRLELPAGSPVLVADTVGYGGGEPMALYQAYIRSPAAELVEAALRLRRESVQATYEIAGLALGFDHLTADQTFEASLGDATAARILQIPIGAPIFRVSTVFRAPDGLPIESRIAHYRADRYSFHIERELRLEARRDGPTG